MIMCQNIVDFLDIVHSLSFALVTLYQQTKNRLSCHTSVKNDGDIELNTKVLSKNEHVCSLSKLQEYDLTLKCNKTL